MPSAHAEYMREFRERNPELYDAQLRAGRAFRRALTTLRRRHLDEFATILTTERAAVGLPPVGELKRGPRRRDDAA